LIEAVELSSERRGDIDGAERAVEDGAREMF